jgi:hypothetical protein
MRALAFWTANMVAAGAIYWIAATPGDQIVVGLVAGFVLGFVGIRAGKAV